MDGITPYIANNPQSPHVSPSYHRYAGLEGMGVVPKNPNRAVMGLTKGNVYNAYSIAFYCEMVASSRR